MTDSQPQPRRSPPIRLRTALVILVLSTMLSLAAAEALLRLDRWRITSKEQLDAGLVNYDPVLGWQLTPNWSGRHIHHDFDVHYKTSRFGYRGEFPSRQPTVAGRKAPPDPNRPKRIAVLGDSFTFGFGVADQHTFVHRLNRHANKKGTHASTAFMNLGVPGFSTDQQMLLIRNEVIFFNPDGVLLVVYLGNDLLDNLYPFPLQAERAKPYFKLTKYGLKHRHNPVPLEAKPPDQQRRTLSGVVLGESPLSDDWKRWLDWRIPVRWWSGLELAQRTGLGLWAPPSFKTSLDDRFTEAITLFEALITRSHQTCTDRRTPLTLVLLPGRSYIERPRGHSAQFQEHQREKITEVASSLQIPVIDLASEMREEYSKKPERWYFPNDGHLTPKGHKAVAKLIWDAHRSQQVTKVAQTPPAD